jgi:hypothetical protein
VPDPALTIDEVLSILRESPPRIAAGTAGLEPAHLHTTTNDGEWSANEVLAHLRACADVWGKCILEIITRDRPALRAVSPRTWIRKTDYLKQEFHPALQAFTTQRAALLAVLEPLAIEDWSRAATVTGAGKVLERSVLSYADGLARHERVHVLQIEHNLKSNEQMRDSGAGL